jgi:hypothetical protein
MLSSPVMNIQSSKTNSIRKLTDPQLVKTFSASYRTQRFINMFKKACHLSLSSVSSIQPKHSQIISFTPIRIFSYNLCLGLPRGLHPSGFPQTPYMHLSCSTQILIAMSIFWDIIHSLVDMYQHFRGTHCLIIRAEDRGSRLLLIHQTI